MSENEFIPISNEEATSFAHHANNEKALFDPDGEGPRYCLIQPYDLGRFAETVIALRKAITDARRTALLDAAQIADEAREDAEGDVRVVRDRIRALVQ